MKMQHIQTRIDEIKQLSSKGEHDLAEGYKQGLMKQFIRDIAVNFDDDDGDIKSVRQKAQRILAGILD